jgi:hypothetical protein
MAGRVSVTEVWMIERAVKVSREIVEASRPRGPLANLPRKKVVALANAARRLLVTLEDLFPGEADGDSHRH